MNVGGLTYDILGQVTNVEYKPGADFQKVMCQQSFALERSLNKEVVIGNQ